MKQPRASGFLIIKEFPVRRFLLMKHPQRWDLPKGHVDPGESDLDCAFRELEEETGIRREDIVVDPEFRHVSRYTVDGKRYGMGHGPIEKTTLIFLARLQQDVRIRVTEHEGFQWFDWNPPHRIQTTAIDPLLARVEEHFRSATDH